MALHVAHYFINVKRFLLFLEIFKFGLVLFSFLGYGQETLYSNLERNLCEKLERSSREMAKIC